MTTAKSTPPSRQAGAIRLTPGDRSQERTSSTGQSAKVFVNPSRKAPQVPDPAEDQLDLFDDPTRS